MRAAAAPAPARPGSSRDGLPPSLCGAGVGPSPKPRHPSTRRRVHFGGAVPACRPAEAGRSVLVLERGREWAVEEYPGISEKHWIRDVDRPESENGWIDVRAFGNMAVVQGAGVGGGSLGSLRGGRSGDSAPHRTQSGADDRRGGEAHGGMPPHLVRTPRQREKQAGRPAPGTWIGPRLHAPGDDAILAARKDRNGNTDKRP